MLKTWTEFRSIVAKALLFGLPVALFLVILVSIPVWGAETVISGTVRAADGGFVSGVVLIEEGRLYGKKFRYGGLIEDGSFSVG